ncbi:hypothetical protein JGU71_08955 [Antrihabitans sp. YC3-6]|uniref:DUF3558 domain-containing protein n=1 Tax=Antrihabitans stalagmiti TaxID=2799499 RepID=A0A934NPG1_9NOCA|nr:hypothetical protein [Antrihabitans stalagmiti]MBJ8339011.1 hypothetical protein [Antrihabitans stalagmiti]
MRNTRIYTAVLSIGVLAASAAGCSSVRGTAVPIADSAGFDLCSVLSIDDVEGSYVRSDEPISLRTRITSNVYVPGGIAACEFGTAIATGLTLGVPLGEPAPDIADLAHSPYTSEGGDTEVGNDKAYQVESEFDSIIAVQHGNTQFYLAWEPLLDIDDEGVTPEQMIELAQKVADKLPETIDLPKSVLPGECDGIGGVDAIVGDVTSARGSVDDDNLYCDYLGPEGILNTEARREDGKFVQRLLDSERKVSPENEVKPSIDDGTAIFSPSSISGLRLDGYLADCCTFEIEYESEDYKKERSTDFDDDERTLVTSFVAAARSWSS